MRYPFWIRRPKTTLLLWFVFLIACVIPIAGPALAPAIKPIFPGLQLLVSIKGAIQSNDPDRAFDAESKQTFGDDEYAIIAIEHPNNVLNLETLTQVDRITRALKQLEGVRDIWSLTDMDHIRGKEGGELDTADLIADLPKSPEEFARVIAVVNAEIDKSSIIPNYIISTDKKSAMIVAEIDTTHSDPAKRNELIAKIAKMVDEEKAKTPGTVHIAGIAVNDYYTGVVMLKDQELYMMGALLMCTLVMTLIFRRWQGVASVLIVLIIGTVGTVAAIAVARQLMSPIVAFAPNVITALTMGYTLYMLYGHVEYVYEQVADGKPVTDHRALVHGSQQEEKRAYLFAVLTTAVGFIALRTNSVPDLAAYGLFAGIGALITGAVAYTAIPALLVLKPIKLKPNKPLNPWIQGVANAVSRSTLKRPKVHLAGSLALIAVGAIGLSMSTLEFDIIRTWWSADDPVRIDEEFIRDRTGGATVLRTVVVSKSLDYFKEPANLKKLDEVQEFIKKQPHVTKVVSHVDHIKLINRALHADDPAHLVIPSTKAEIEQYLLLHKEPDDFRPVIDSDYRRTAIMVKMNTMDSKKLKAFEDTVEAFTTAKFTDIQETRVVGTTLLIHRAFDVIVRQTMNSLGLAVLIMALLLWLLLRTTRVVGFVTGLKIATLMFIPNLAPLLVSLGFMGLVGKPLNPTLTLAATAALGIAMDDTVHMFFAWLRGHEAGLKPLEAAAAAVRRTGRPVLLTSIGVIAGFSTLLTGRHLDTVWTSLMFMITLGTALVFDMFLTPVLFSFLKLKKVDDTGEPAKKAE